MYSACLQCKQSVHLYNGKQFVIQIITTSMIPSCPICLQQPAAARITKCGHSYCLSCIIHYLQLIDDEEKPNRKWRKCPICWDAIYARDLKSVRFWIIEDLKRPGNGKPAESAITMR